MFYAKLIGINHSNTVASKLSTTWSSLNKEITYLLTFLLTYLLTILGLYATVSVSTFTIFCVKYTKTYNEAPYPKSSY